MKAFLHRFIANTAEPPTESEYSSPPQAGTELGEIHAAKQERFSALPLQTPARKRSEAPEDGQEYCGGLVD